MICKKFFWNEQDSKGGMVGKLYTMAWNNLVAPKKLDGLNINALRHKNEAKLEKWWWWGYMQKVENHGKL